MNTRITDKDFYLSASNLTRQHLQANIYENIHILAILLDCIDNLILSDKCKAKLKKCKNYPQVRLWVGYERQLLYYIHCHLCEWNNRNYKSIINIKNYDILYTQTLKNKGILDAEDCICIPWITDELIQTHRSVLIQKEINQEIKLNMKYLKYTIKSTSKKTISNDLYALKVDNLIRNNYHYRKLWPDCPVDLKMHYNWR